MYAHLNEVLVQEEEEIEASQLVALSGNTGLSTGAHLHYTVWQGEEMELIDPIDFVDLPYTETVKLELSK